MTRLALLVRAVIVGGVAVAFLLGVSWVLLGVGFKLWTVLWPALGFLATPQGERPERQADPEPAGLSWERFLLRLFCWCGLFPLLVLAVFGLIAIGLQVVEAITGYSGSLN